MTFDDALATQEAEAMGMQIYYFGLLKKGPTWTLESTPEVEKLQEAHLVNIKRMVAEGNLVLVGPFVDDSEFRGAYIFKADSLAEAEAMARFC